MQVIIMLPIVQAQCDGVGDKAAYKILGQCKNDKQALEGLVKIYKTLYPQPKQL